MIDDDITTGPALHIPVMPEEVLELLNPSPGKIVVDCTVGGGGHSSEILKKIRPDGFLIGIDKDEDVLRETFNRFSREFGSSRESSIEQIENDFHFYQADFRDLGDVLDRAGKGKVDGVLLDLGVSSMQLDTPERGFSFGKEGPLDMRMDRSSNITAFDVVNKSSKKELEYIIREFGEDWQARKIADAIVQQRRKVGCIKTTLELARLIKSTVRYSPKKIDPSTLTFQALRIVVNKELEALEILLNSIHGFLKENGRIVVISFHSLEDRIVKNVFRNGAKQGLLNVLTPKPLRATEGEARRNPRSRSAKLRASERI